MNELESLILRRAIKRLESTAYLLRLLFNSLDDRGDPATSKLYDAINTILQASYKLRKLKDNL